MEFEIFFFFFFWFLTHLTKLEPPLKGNINYLNFKVKLEKINALRLTVKITINHKKKEKKKNKY